MWSRVSSLLGFTLGIHRPGTGESPQECPRKRGVSEGVSDGVSVGPFGLRALECPKSFPRVSPECPGYLFDTPVTLSGHFLDTPESGARRALQTPRRTLTQTPPVFRDTLRDTPGTLRARRARETPVPGRRVPKLYPPIRAPFWLSSMCIWVSRSDFLQQSAETLKKQKPQACM